MSSWSYEESTKRQAARCNCAPYYLLLDFRSGAQAKRIHGAPCTAVWRPKLVPTHKGRAAVNKRTITILSLVAIVLLVSAFVGFGPAFSTHPRSCQSSINGTNATSCLSSASSAVIIGFVLYLVGAIAALAAWIMGLIKTAQIGRWAGSKRAKPTAVMTGPSTNGSIAP
jgi:hypothetical protein